MIPIVFGSAGDPVSNRLVQSLTRPGANVTGLSIELTDSVGKRLELRREVVPVLHRLAILFNDGGGSRLRMHLTLQQRRNNQPSDLRNTGSQVAIPGKATRTAKIARSASTKGTMPQYNSVNGMSGRIDCRMRTTIPGG